MSIRRLTSTLAQVTNEVTLAAANLNFDFSLVKPASPQEFGSTGSQLSAARKDEAENGSCHVTARKLGALFQEVIPATPTLIRTYGLRASGISNDSRINPKIGANDHLSASQVGLDGSGIWAAATSGDAAIGVHLLACMLARIWRPLEATSI